MIIREIIVERELIGEKFLRLDFLLHDEYTWTVLYNKCIQSAVSWVNHVLILRLKVLSEMNVSDELTDDQTRQLTFDLDVSYNAFIRTLKDEGDWTLD